MIRVSCFTCLGRGAPCTDKQCGRIAEVLPDVICKDCSKLTKAGRSPSNIVLCGQHPRPPTDEIINHLESWIPALNIRALTPNFSVNLTILDFNKTALPDRRILPPAPATAINTVTGHKSDLPPDAKIIRQSNDAAFCVMQTLRIHSTNVLTFYDSGANGNLICGEVADRSGLTVLDSRSAVVTVMGGGTVDTGFGLYSCMLGPDADGQYHELELQGIQRITKVYPRIDMTPLIQEASFRLPCQRWPTEIGGDEVKMLIGLKNSHLYPKQMFILPSGVAVYESLLVDIHGSRLWRTTAYGILSCSVS
jgi:hypothetical protein